MEGEREAREKRASAARRSGADNCRAAHVAAACSGMHTPTPSQLLLLTARRDSPAEARTTTERRPREGREEREGERAAATAR